MLKEYCRRNDGKNCHRSDEKEVIHSMEVPNKY